MKRIISIMLILLLVISFSACKVKKDENDPVLSASETENNKNEQTQINKDEENESTESVTDEHEIQVDDTVTDKEINVENNIDDNDNGDVTKSEQPESTESDEENIDKESEDEKIRWVIDTAEPFHKVDYGNIENVGNSYGTSDCFIGRITNIEQVTLDEDIIDKYFYPNMSEEYADKHSFILNEDFHSVVYPLNAELYIYTVEIEKSIFSIFTEQNKKIKVIADVSDMTEAYKTGESYIMKGTLYQYKGETVIRLLDQFRAKVNDDGTLTGLSQDAKLFDNIKTVDEFENNEHIKKIFTKHLSIPTEFSQSYGVPKYELATADKYKGVLDKIIADGKKAVIADSEFKMNLEKADEVK